MLRQKLWWPACEAIGAAAFLAAQAEPVQKIETSRDVVVNTFERLAPSEAPQPIRELTANLLEMFGAPDASVPEEMPRDVYIQFAATRPITVEIEGSEKPSCVAEVLFRLFA